MARKGEVLTKIDVNLGSALRDWLRKNNQPNAKDVARLLHLPIQASGRIKEILEGKRNTTLFAHRLVRYLFNGDYLKLEKYTTSESGMEWVRLQDQLRKEEGLTENDKQNAKKLRELYRRAILEGKGQVAVKALESLFK